jgi:hypothetical protein
MTLCTAAGPVTVKGDPAAPAAPAKQDGSCAFAQIGPAAPAPVPYVAGLPVLFAIVTPEPVKAALRLGEGLGRPPLPATGPPATS